MDDLLSCSMNVKPVVVLVDIMKFIKTTAAFTGSHVTVSEVTELCEQTVDIC